MPNKLLCFAVILCACAGVALTLFLTHRAAHEPREVASSQRVPIQGSKIAKQVSVAAEAARQQKAISSNHPTEKIRGEFENSPNYAAFIQQSIQRPQEGGRFYAWLTYNRCEELLNARIATPENLSDATDPKSRAHALLSGLVNRCSGVRSQFPDQATFERAIRSMNSQGVPDALLLESSSLRVASKTTSTNDMQRARTSGDPYLLAVTLDMNVEFLAEGIDSAYARGRNRPTLFAASAAAACEIIGNCRDNIQLMIPCVSGGGCKHQDLRDFLRDGLDPEARQLYDKTKAALLKVAGK